MSRARPVLLEKALVRESEKDEPTKGDHRRVSYAAGTLFDAEQPAMVTLVCPAGGIPQGELQYPY